MEGDTEGPVEVRGVEGKWAGGGGAEPWLLPPARRPHVGTVPGCRQLPRGKVGLTAPPPGPDPGGRWVPGQAGEGRGP